MEGFMFEGILQAISKPKQLFERFEEEPKLVSLAFLVILIVSVLSAIVEYVPLAKAFSANTITNQLVLISAPLVTIAVSILLWLVYGLLVRMGAGIDIKPWAITAYSLSPQILFSIILLIIALVFPIETTPISLDLNDTNAITTLQQEINRSLFGRSSQILSYLAVVWQLLLVYIGVNVLSNQSKALRSTILVGIFAFGFLCSPLIWSAVA